jgi:hypothetical protein
MEGLLRAMTVHTITGQAIYGVVTLEQQGDGSWAGTCSGCGKPFDSPFERQVLALRN